MEKGKRMNELSIGDKASTTKQITEADVIAFAQVSGDWNPVHLDREFASQTRFKERIAHGMLTASLISNVIGNKLPGPGIIYLTQSLKFTEPVKFGDIITAEVEVIEKNPEHNCVRMRTICYNQKAVVVIDGEATVMPPL